MLTDDLFYGTKKHHKRFIELSEPLKQYLGITTACYINMDLDTGMKLVSSNSKWVERYLEESYYKQDPGIVHPSSINSGFTFVTTSNDQEYKEAMLKEAIHEFNFHHGFCYVEKNCPTNFTLFYFATHKENNKILNKVVNETNLVKKFIRNLNKQILSEFKDLEDNKVDPFKLKGDLFLEQKGIVFNEDQENHDKIKILQNEGLISKNYDNLESINLTRQEINCLRIYVEDYSIKGIAKNLNIAVTTAISHIEKIKQKLNCSNRQELLKTADVLVGLGKL